MVESREMIHGNPASNPHGHPVHNNLPDGTPPSASDFHPLPELQHQQLAQDDDQPPPILGRPRTPQMVTYSTKDTADIFTSLHYSTSTPPEGGNTLKAVLGPLEDALNELREISVVEGDNHSASKILLGRVTLEATYHGMCNETTKIMALSAPTSESIVRPTHTAISRPNPQQYYLQPCSPDQLHTMNNHAASLKSPIPPPIKDQHISSNHASLSSFKENFANEQRKRDEEEHQFKWSWRGSMKIRKML